MIAYPPCLACAHFDRATQTCAAYPVEIPRSILVEGGEHDALRGDEVEAVTFRLDERMAAYDAQRRRLGA